jgi:predicted negative regulator of RcsB-dependent stress response
MTEEELQKIKERRKNNRWLLLVCVIALGLWISYNAWAYGDWTCAFARCVKASMMK